VTPDSSGNFLYQFGSAGSGNGQFSSPSGDAFYPATGNLYVLDSGNYRVQVFGTGGTGLASTTTALASAPNPSTPGQAVTYTATVSPVAPATGTPTGTVSFSDGSTPIAGCTAQALSGGAATCTVTYASAGSHSVTAAYGGDTDFAASGPSNVVNQVVSTPAPSVTSIRPASGPGTGGTKVIISGDNLCQVTGVDFGTAASAHVSVEPPTNGDCQVTAISPPGSGVVDVTVTSPGGTSAISPQDQFTYQ
jgi:Bacterial Ig-like domain (group 3)/IPT/TIG domain